MAKPTLKLPPSKYSDDRLGALNALSRSQRLKKARQSQPLSHISFNEVMHPEEYDTLTPSNIEDYTQRELAKHLAVAGLPLAFAAPAAMGGSLAARALTGAAINAGTGLPLGAIDPEMADPLMDAAIGAGIGAAGIPGAAVGAVLGYSPEAEAGAIPKLLRMGSAEVGKWLDEAFKGAQPGSPERIENIVRDMPHTAEVYDPYAVKRAVDLGTQLRGVTPDEFLELAYPLNMNSNTRGYRDHYADLVREGRWSEPAPGLFTSRYEQETRVRPYKGFSDVPFLEIQERPMDWKVRGHEGRHRNLALSKLYGSDTPNLTRFIRQYDLEKPLERKFPHIVVPEVDEGYSLDLSRAKRYAEGGLAQYAGGGAFKLGKDAVKNYHNWIVRKLTDPNASDLVDWYGDSKTMNKRGHIMPFFHGSNVDNQGILSPSSDGMLGQGIYITPDPNYASMYASGEGGNVTPLLAALKRPLELTADKRKEPVFQIAEHPAFQDFFLSPGYARRWARNQMDEWAGIGDEEFPSMLREAGFDSVILRDPRHKEILEATATRPDQLKSAIRSGFNQFGRDPDIRRKEGGLAQYAGGGMVRKGLELFGRRPMFEEGVEQAATLPGQLGVIKGKGGNWLTGSVEKALQPLKRGTAGGMSIEDALQQMNALYTPQAMEALPAESRATVERSFASLRNEDALNRWIEGPMQKYVKNQMATPEDPVRALAEQGILHVGPEDLNFNESMLGRHLGRPKELRAGQSYMGRSPMAQAWEGVSDNALLETPAKYVEELGKSRGMSDDLSWARKVDPETPVFEPSTPRHLPADLGFTHLTDELRNALNPAAGLPRELQLTPDKLKQMGMEKAVRHVDAINKWRAAAMEQAKLKELETSGSAGTLVKDYPDAGMRWVEYTKPEKLADPNSVKQKGKGWVAVDKEGNEIGQRLPSGEFVPPEPVSTPELAYLQGMLTTEGNIMGHCVGGYCDDVASGEARIFSLRDAKGEPHVTIEVAPSTSYQEFYRANKDILNSPEFKGRVAEIAKTAFDEEEAIDDVTKLLKASGVTPAHPGFKIHQVKGKSNKKPKDEYLPFVQDFIRNPTLNAPLDVMDDLQNTGLFKLGNKYVSPAELENVAKRHYEGWGSPSQAVEPAYDYYRRLIRYDPSMLSDADLNFIKDIKDGNFD